MKPDIEIKITRAILAGLLNSNIPATELQEYAHRLDDRKNLSKLQRSIILTFDIINRETSIDIRKKERDRSVEKENILKVVQQKKIPKIVIWNTLKILDSEFSKLQPEKYTIAKLVEIYVNRNNNSSEKFINIFNDSEEDGDPYLQGIIKRPSK